MEEFQALQGLLWGPGLAEFLGEKASPKERTKEDEHRLKLDAGAGMEGAGSPLLPKEFLQPERSIQGLIEFKDKLRNAPDMHPAGKLSA